MKKIVIIGGGTGLSTVMKGFKTLGNVELSAIVTVADDGGSTGRLRKQFQIPAVGDIRNVMISMAKSESLLSELMNYRFDGSDDVGGHNLGNLILTALLHTTGSLQEAIRKLSKVLNVKGEIIPSTTQTVNLFARMEDDTIICGESNIPTQGVRIKEVFYQDHVVASEEAVQAIKEADYIVYGIGSLYTSIMPNIIIPDIKKALIKSKAKKIYFCNAMTQYKETDNYTLEDHVDAIIKHAGENIIDIVVTYNNEMFEKRLALYAAKNSYPVIVAKEKHDYELWYEDVLDFESKLIRHDSDKLKKVMRKLMRDKV